MKNFCKLSVLFPVVLFIAIGVGSVLGADKYPAKPITLVVHAAAGGGSDIFARTLASSAWKRRRYYPNRWSSKTSRGEAEASPLPMWQAKREIPTIW